MALGISQLLPIAGVTLLAGVATLESGSGKSKTTRIGELNWETSLDAAKAKAKRENKPILFMHMFGRLDEEMCCANARTLRAILFKNPEFQSFAKEKAVVAWEMVRPVPKIEIDFGDGRKLKRTVRGNAVIYLLDSDGKILDAYAGVHRPEEFMPLIKESYSELYTSKKTQEEVITWHDARYKPVRLLASTMSKMGSESPVLNLMGERPFAGANPSNSKPVDAKRARFLQSAAMVRDLSLTPATPGEVALTTTGAELTKENREEISAKIIENDSKRNAREMRSVMHAWIGSLKSLPTPNEAKDDVFETILKIPYKDPNFGLTDFVIPGTPNR